MKRYVCLPRTRIERAPYAMEAVQPRHIESIRQWRNAQLDVLRQAAPITAEQQQQYYATHIWPAMEQPRPANILVSYLRQGRLIGYGGLVHIAWEHRRAEVSFLLDPNRERDRAGHRIDCLNFMALVRELAFEDLGLHRLCTETYAIREYWIDLLVESGFRFEGVMREHVFIGGNPVNSLIHGCLRTDAG